MTDDPHEAGRDAEIPRYLRRAAPSDRTGLEDRPRAVGTTPAGHHPRPCPDADRRLFARFHDLRHYSRNRDFDSVNLNRHIATSGLRPSMVVNHFTGDLRLQVRARLGRAPHLKASSPDRRDELDEHVLHGVVRLVASAPHGIGAHDGREGGVERRPCLVVILLDVRADRIIYLFHV